ncbi:hypothetical protein JTE90_013739 [Oedothorax gibbosus]|uniref:RFX-type winged-helix domain-containing protein n=1 Tax=Oedothorax gibbosus TaxID=931172 RepID=A0AAV6V045_9ARAC|nr:hypothetical protein JTE90_013739 [Oedothorax gibbosus]
MKTQNEIMTEKSDTENVFLKDSSSKLDLSTTSNSKQIDDDSSEAKLLQLERKSTKKYLLKTKSLRQKKHQAAQTTDWLRTHYCSCPNVCLPREIIYDHYLKFCQSQKMLPICKATFGKVIRNTFPTVSSKRLGARGQSRYYYDGIGIKPKGEHLHSITGSKHGITRFSSSSYGKHDPTPKMFSLNTKVGTLLPRFPDIDDLSILNPTAKEKIRIFLTMYSIHCQCIVDAAISGHFEEVRIITCHRFFTDQSYNGANNYIK